MSSLALQPELLLNQRLWPELSALQLLYYHYLVIVHSSCHCATDLSLCNDLLIGAVFLSLCKYPVIVQLPEFVHLSCCCAIVLSSCDHLVIVRSSCYRAVILSLCKYLVIKAKIERFAISLLLCMREPDIAT